jgi:glyoxylate reductase
MVSSTLGTHVDGTDITNNGTGVLPSRKSFWTDRTLPDDDEPNPAGVPYKGCVWGGFASELTREYTESMNDVLITRRVCRTAADTLAEAGLSFDVGPDDREMTRRELLSSVRGRRGVLCLLSDRVDAELLDAAGPQCRIFANYAVGFDNIDVPAATQRGVLITNTPEVLTDATADLTFALLLAAARRVVEGDRLVRSGRWAGWAPLQLLGRDPTDAVLGLVGAGRIGTAVARRARAFRMRILYYDRSDNAELDAGGAERVELETLLGESDFVSIHLSLTGETRGLIGAKQLALMKPTACLINTARGPIVDEAALVEALSAGRPGSAGLDVYEREPVLAPGLDKLDNVVLLPHLGSATERARARMAELAAGSIVEALRGKRPRNLVNPEAWKP